MGGDGERLVVWGLSESGAPGIDSGGSEELVQRYGFRTTGGGQEEGAREPVGGGPSATWGHSVKSRD